MTIGKNPLYHFTDIRNIPSIKEHGLLSLAELKRRSIEIPAAGGNQWSHDADCRMGLAEYVHLCFFNQHPMEFIAKRDGRINESAFLKINPIVLQWEGVRVTLEVANKSGTKLLTLAQAMEEIDSEIMCKWTDWSNPDVQERRQMAKKYEVLVPNIIPIEFIMGI
jgi:hypothetical protein